MEDRSRACDRCGAQNIATADFCWQCLAPFAPAGRQPVSGPTPLATRPGGPPTPQQVPDAPPPSPATDHGAPVPVAVAVRMGDPLAPPDPATRASAGASPVSAGPVLPPIEPGRRQAMVGGSIALIAAAVVGVMFFVLSEAKIRIPERIGDVQRLETNEAEQFEGFVEGMAGADGIEAEAAVYADELGLTMFLIAGEEDSPMSAEMALRAFSTGVEAADSQTTVRLTRLRARTRQGVPYACAPMDGPLRGGLCAWKDPETVGFVFAPEQSVRRVLDLTHQSYQAVRS